MIGWEELFKLTRKDCRVPERLLCLDPGETTGWALFEKQQLVRWGQIETINGEEILWHNLVNLLIGMEPTYIVCEDYRVYQHKLERHSFSPVMTLRLIGGIDLLSLHGWYSPIIYDQEVLQHNTCPIHYQMATQAKAFVTDEKLKAWDFWQSGMRHSRDAIRHGCYFLLFYKRGEDIV